MKFERVLYFCVLVTIPVSGKISRILGGRDASIIEHPYQVAITIEDTDAYNCGGAIITNEHVITAAHCVYNYLHLQLKIIAGTSSLDNPSATIYRARRVNVHPYFTGVASEHVVAAHDIAIIRLEESIIFDEYRNKIDLPSLRSRPGDAAIISGWGSTTYPGNSIASTLQKAAVRIISNNECAMHYQFPIRDDQMCTLDNAGIGICHGDSGGPVVRHGKLIGIMSFNVPCSRSTPDVHTNVYLHLNYIKSVIES